MLAFIKRANVKNATLHRVQRLTLSVDSRAFIEI